MKKCDFNDKNSYDMLDGRSLKRNYKPCKFVMTEETEKAKKIRKNLLIWGVVLTLLGGIGCIVAIVVMLSGFSNFPSSLMIVGQTTLSLSSNCPSMGEPGWFECEKAQNDIDFENKKK